MSINDMENQTKPNANILVSILPLAILFVLIQAASLIGFFHYSFRAVEKYAIEKNLQSCVHAMQTELDRISSIVYEWSAWDATVLFVNGKDPNYPQDNAIEDSMKKQNINLVCFLDSLGKPVWTHCVKIHNNEPEIFNLALLSPIVLAKNTALWEHHNPESCLTGYYSTEGGVLMLCSRPITHSGQTNVQGTVIMGRFLNDKLIASFTRQECLDFEWWNLRTEYTKNAMQEYLTLITNENPVYITITPDSATAYTILPDIYGKDAILIKFVTPNDVASFKKGWLVRCSVIYAIEGLIFIAYLAAFANKHCLRCRAQIREDSLPTKTAEPASFKHAAEMQFAADDLPI